MNNLLLEFKICFPYEQKYEDFLEELGYERRQGTYGKHKYFMVYPFKRWYYPADVKYGDALLLEVKEEVITTKTLVDEDGRRYFKS